jgi:hypothetical protein
VDSQWALVAPISDFGKRLIQKRGVHRVDQDVDVFGKPVESVGGDRIAADERVFDARIWRSRREAMPGPTMSRSAAMRSPCSSKRRPSFSENIIPFLASAPVAGFP